MSQSLCCLVCLQKHETIFREIVCTATLTIEKQRFPRSAFCRGLSPRSPCFRRFLGSSGVTNFGRDSPCHAHPVQPIKSEVPFFPIDPKGGQCKENDHHIQERISRRLSLHYKRPAERTHSNLRSRERLIPEPSMSSAVAAWEGEEEEEAES